MSRCIVITLPYSLGLPGGGALDCCQTACHLSSAGAEVIVLPVSTHRLSRFPRPHTREPLLGHQQEVELGAHSVKVIRVAPNPVHWLLDGLSIKKAVQSILAQRGIDAVLSFWQEAAFLPDLLHSNKVVFGVIAAAPYTFWFGGPRLTLAELLREKNGSRSTIRFVRSFVYRSVFRNDFVQALKSQKRRIWLDRPLRKADIIFARSKFTREGLIDLFGVSDKRVTVSYCGVNPVFTRVQRLFLGDVSRFIFYGSFLAQKGVFDALEALGRLAAQGWRNWRLKIAGWGDEERLHRVAREHGISDRVVLLGHLDHPALVRELEWAQLAILPSHFESFGLAIAEAQAAGLPVIACEVGGVPEVVKHNVTGWLVPPSRVDLLAEAIREAMQDPEKTYRMGLAGRDWVTRRFSWKRTAETMLQTIEEIVARKTSC